MSDNYTINRTDKYGTECVATCDSLDDAVEKVENYMKSDQTRPAATYAIYKLIAHTGLTRIPDWVSASPKKRC